MSAVPLHLRPQLAPYVRLQLDPVTGGRVLLFPEGILELNASAAEIVALGDGSRTVAQILTALAEEYTVAAAELEADVLACLADLQRRALVVLAP